MDQRKDTPGWNDPPMLKYNSSNPPPKTRITNKRLAFPVSNPSTTKSPLTSSMPPATPPLVPPIVPLAPPEQLNVSLVPSVEPLNVPAVPSLNADIFEISVKNLEKHFKTDVDKKVFRDLWKDDKFSEDCKQNIYLLSQYLEENNTDGAQEVKNKLLTQFESVCVQWLKDIEV